MMYATVPMTPDQDPSKQSLYRRVGAWGDPANPTGPRRDQYDPSSDVSQTARENGFVPDFYSPSVVKQGQPLRNDTSSTAVASNPQPEVDTDQSNFVQAKLPPESDGRGSQSATDQLAPLSGIEQRVQANINRLSSDPNFTGPNPYQMPTARIPASTGRKILANVAGLGVGMINPERGLNLRQSILDQPTVLAQQNVQMRRAPVEQENADLLKLGGLTQEGYQRQAELNAAAARMKAADNRGTQLNNEANAVETFEVGGDTPGSKQRMMVNKVGGGNQRTIGAQILPSNAEKAANLEKVVGPDGTVSMVDKVKGTSVVVLDEKGQPLKDGSQSAQAFYQYWNNLPSNQRNSEAVLRFQTASAAQYGANKENDEAGKAVKAGHTASVSSGIFSRVTEKDPAKAREHATQILTRAVQAHGNEPISDEKGAPTFAEVAKDVQAEIDKRYAGFNKTAPAKSRSTVILPSNGVSGVTINNQ